MSDGRATTSVRQAARKAAFAAQTRRRTQQAERDKRVDAGVLALVIALKERTDAEHRAATAIRGLIAEGLTPRDVVDCTDGDLTLRDARRLAHANPDAARTPATES